MSSCVSRGVVAERFHDGIEIGWLVPPLMAATAPSATSNSGFGRFQHGGGIDGRV